MTVLKGFKAAVPCSLLPALVETGGKEGAPIVTIPAG